jgi:hypothetical protein
MDISLGASPLDAAVALQTYLPGTWNPQTQGPIHSIDLAFDFISLNGAPTLIGFVVEQDGVYYAHTVNDTASNTTWEPYTSLATESDFQVPMGTATPDFSSEGGEMRFGLYAQGHTSFIHGIDNWNVHINPLPETLELADGDFSDSDWLVDVLTTGEGEVNSVQTVTSGGNPGLYREMDISLGASPQDAAVAVQIYVLDTWNPQTQGPIYSIDLAFDFISLNGAPTEIGFIVEQDGVYYAHTVSETASNTTWESFASLATESDFLVPFGTATPDFSSEGGEIFFGFATGQFGLQAQGHTSFIHGIDNWSVHVNPHEDMPSALPESEYAVRPPSFTLHANHPNPFNAATSIAYELSTPSLVELRVYDAGGRLVRTLQDRRIRTSGFHRLSWDGRDERGREVAAGVYFSHIRVNSREAARKMLLLK